MNGIKKYQFSVPIALLISFFSLMSCSETVSSEVLIDVKEFQTEVADSAILYVEGQGDLVNFSCNVKINEGMFNLLLVNSLNDTLVNEQVKAPKNFKLNADYERLDGPWMIQYSVSKIGNTSPSGSYSLKLTYSN